MPRGARHCQCSACHARVY
ncbi:hypothetical protein KZX46_02040 (plasmid) [Polymorphobacter sp. PAMC 29334]|nr:hypothetical protein KZX46_02040 [Polymorphobacter sp. PAMC 29334]